jgi:hypothetical protein
VHALVKDLRQLEDGKQQAAALRRRLKAAADPIRAQVRANASWSRRIPGAVSIGTKFTKRSTGVFIKVNSKRAPHARPLENNGQPGTFRHPVFGRDVWVVQRARPFFFADTARHMPQVEQAAIEAINDAARAVGFR